MNRPRRVVLRAGEPALAMRIHALISATQVEGHLLPRTLREVAAHVDAPGYFIRMGFSIVPHSWLAEKVVADCLRCPQFCRCGQHAILLALDATIDLAPRDTAVAAPYV